MSLTKHVTTEDFQTEVVDSDVPVVIDFWAAWCGPCRAIGPILDELSVQYQGKVKVAKVDVDAQPQLAGAFRVRSIPALFAVHGGEVVHAEVGFRGRPALEALFAELSTLGARQAS